MKKLPKIAVAQFNPTVGDLPGNADKIIQWIQEAETNKADLIVFPEASLCGYPIWDLANKRRFLNDEFKELKRITRATQKCSVQVVLGFVDKPKNKGDKSYNSLAWISKGKINLTYHKQLLPNYDVFLEKIFFSSGQKSAIKRWRGQKIGLLICEDIWDDSYGEKPIEALKKQKVDWILNISASPYYKGVDKVRKKHLQQKAKDYKLPMLYVNQVGGQDDLLFDGHSLLVNEKGQCVYEAPKFEEGLYFWNSDPKQKTAKKLPRKLEEAAVYDALVMGVRDYCNKNAFKSVVIGLSGGIDSALVAALAVDALGPEAVTGITMPSGFSSKGSWQDSESLAENLGIEIRNYPIETLYNSFIREGNVQRSKKMNACKPDLAMENLQARLRGLQLMFVSNQENMLLLTTGNKSELANGYCTLYGDMAGGLCVLGDVYKTDVFKLAKYRNTISKVIPESIINKAPSAELRPNQKDEDSLPPYEILDAILFAYIEENKSRDEIEKLIRRKYRVKKSLVGDVLRKVDHNEYKRRQTPPILRVSPKAWFGRRMPITNRFKN